MKFCYCDESGTGDEPFAVMAGILVDSTRMHITKDDWQDHLALLSRMTGKTIPEFHTRDFYPGNGIWRTVAGKDRALVARAIAEWLSARKHCVVYSAVDKAKHANSLGQLIVPDELNTPWRFIGFHLVLSVQKWAMQYDRNKGHTIFIFDNEERERLRFTDLLLRPPAWSDTYYDRRNKQAALDQIVDVPYFGDSRDVALIQVADFVAFYLRKWIDLNSGLVQPKYDDEVARVSEIVGKLRPLLIQRRFIYPKTGRDTAADLFFEHAPRVLTDAI